MKGDFEIAFRGHLIASLPARSLSFVQDDDA